MKPYIVVRDTSNANCYIFIDHITSIQSQGIFSLIGLTGGNAVKTNANVDTIMKLIAKPDTSL